MTGETGEAELRAIARRAIGRAMAERGLEAAAPHHGGVSVYVPAAQEPAPAARASRELVSEACLAETPEGGTFEVPYGAVITPLAREQAHRRGIRFVSAGGSGLRASDRLRVAVGADHGGFSMKRDVIAWLGELGCTPVDLGTHDPAPCDYPDYAASVARAVASGLVHLGVCIDGAGIGSAMAANKIAGARAANCADVAMAKNAREHNHANVLTLGAKLPAGSVREILCAFLSTEPGAERHARRVVKITALESERGAQVR
jgi:ribose 5-phosphate isomerase B